MRMKRIGLFGWMLWMCAVHGIAAEAVPSAPDPLEAELRQGQQYVSMMSALETLSAEADRFGESGDSERVEAERVQSACREAAIAFEASYRVWLLLDDKVRAEAPATFSALCNATVAIADAGLRGTKASAARIERAMVAGRTPYVVRLFERTGGVLRQVSAELENWRSVAELCGNPPKPDAGRGK